MALGQAGQQVGGARRDHDAIGPACQFNVAHGLFGSAVPQRGAGRLAGKGLEAEWGDELLGAGRHRHLHQRTGITQASNQFQGLVGRDPAADTQEQFLAFQRADPRRGSVGRISHLEFLCKRGR
ncbi:hypothetical protein D3C78_1483340 [compost metagenome]